MAQRAPLPHSKDEIARRLRMTRAAFALTQREFAAKAGITASAYNRYERAKRFIALDQALKLRAAYGLTLDWIYCGETAGLPIHLLAACDSACRRDQRRATNQPPPAPPTAAVLTMGGGQRSDPTRLNRAPCPDDHSQPGMQLSRERARLASRMHRGRHGRDGCG
jgi:transcriptional regulator with XRE-family HTH domain